MKIVGILGGSFDPIHQGHIALAKHVLKHTSCNEIWFTPTCRTPLKDRQLTDFNQRVAMIRYSIAPYRKMTCCTDESLLSVPNYTIDLVRLLRKKHPSYQFKLIIGGDQAAQFDKWKDYEQLLQLVEVIVVARNQDIDSAKFTYLSTFNSPISSTMVRQGYLQYTTVGARKVIMENGLYFHDIVSYHCSEKRRNHVFSMTEVAIHLAKIHHVCLKKTMIAAMFHDICKEMSVDDSRVIIEKWFIDVLSQRPSIYHAYTALWFLKRNLVVYDKDILYAIAHHVVGDGKTKLAKIIYIADKIDPLRGYDTSKHLALAEKNLDEAVTLIKDNQHYYIKNVEGK